MVDRKANKSHRSVPLVRTAILAPVVSAFEAQGGDAEALLEPHGIYRAQFGDVKAFTPNDTVYAIFQKIAENTSPHFCALVGKNLDWSVFVEMAPTLKEATNLGDFITRFTTALSYEVNAVSLSLLIEGEYAYFTAKRKFVPSVSPAQSDAFQLGMWMALLHRVLDFRWDPLQLVIQIHDPKALPKDFHGLQPIGCDNIGFSFRFPAEWLSHKISLDLLSPASKQYPDRDLSAPIDLLSSVKSLLRMRLSDSKLNVATAAKACGYNVDTLNRRLSAYGTTLSLVLADLRREDAEAALTKGTESVAEIAERLGYSDATAFTRAFKKWTGRSPTGFQKRS